MNGRAPRLHDVVLTLEDVHSLNGALLLVARMALDLYTTNHGMPTPASGDVLMLVSAINRVTTKLNHVVRTKVGSADA